MGGEGRGNKRWERENKKEDDNKQNRTKAKRSRTQKKRVSTKGEMGGWGWTGKAGQEHLTRLWGCNYLAHSRSQVACGAHVMCQAL